MSAKTKTSNITRGAAAIIKGKMEEEEVREVLGLDAETRIGTAQAREALDAVEDAVEAKEKEKDEAPEEETPKTKKKEAPKTKKMAGNVKLQNEKALGFPVELMDIPHPASKEMAIPNRKAVIRTDTNDILNIVTDRYKLVTHLEAFRPVAAALKEAGIKVEKELSGLCMNGGYATYTWILEEGGKVAKGDDIQWTVQVRNSYNYESTLSLDFGAYRLVCDNGLRVPMFSTKKGGKHLTHLDVEGTVAEVKKFLAEAKAALETYKDWSKQDLDRDTVEDLLKRTPDLAKKAQEAILEKLDTEKKVTVWTAYNAFTYYITHQLETQADRLEIAQDEHHRKALAFAAKASRKAA